jgi:transposase
MMMLPPGIKVFIATTPVDMRKSFDGLAAIIQTSLQQNSFSGHLFVFFGKKRDRIKIFYWDRNGFCYWYKRLEKGRFPLPQVPGASFTVSAQELCLLLEGIDLTHPKRLRAV